jgi:apolipoprotein N-acyltransferase
MPDATPQQASIAMLNTASRGWRGHLLAIVAGALLTLSLAPFTLWPFGILSCALLAWLLNDLSPKQAAIRGWCYGLGLFSAGSSWVYVSIHEYGHASVPLALLLTLIFSMGLALFSSLTCYSYARWLRDQLAGTTLGFAAIMVLGEWWRSWFLTGFPWLYLGYAHIDTALAGWAPVAGVYGVSFVVTLTAAVLAKAVSQRQLLLKHWLLPAALWLAAAGLTHIDWVTPTSDPAIKVAMVQANIDQQSKWDGQQYWPTLRLYRSLSEPLWQQYDLVIWPEAAIPGYYHNARTFLDQQSELASASNTSLITGIPTLMPATDSQPRRYHNSIMAFGAGSGLYHKQRLVPFGEYVPLEAMLRGLIQFFDLPMSAFTPGPVGQAPLKAGAISLAPMICYEVAYPDIAGEWLPAADMLITISNDAWFGASIGPLQHLQMAQMRALENGRYLLRATGNGVSAIIDQRGHITSRGQQFSREIISGEAKAFSGATPFAITGSWPIITLCLAIGISLGLITAKMRG